MCVKRTRAFFADTTDFDQYCLVNTAMDATINLFLLSKEGVTPDNNGYMKRQHERAA